MKKALAAVLLLTFAVISVISFVSNASAEEVKMIGVVTKIEMSGNTATASLKDNKTEKVVEVFVADDLTIDKFKDHRIVAGDEIRCKYEVEGGKNVSKIFRKTAGC